MVHIFTYIWTMISTSIIALYDGSECYDGMYLPGWLKIILVLPVRKEKRIPKYIVVVHGIIQIFTVLWLALLLFYNGSINVSRIYGLFLFLGCVPCVLILQKLHSKKHHKKYALNVESAYRMKYHMSYRHYIKIIYERSSSGYPCGYVLAILWDGEYLSYCLVGRKNTEYGRRYRIADALRLKKRTLCFEKIAREGGISEINKSGMDSTEYFANKVIREFFESNAIARKYFSYVGVSCNPNIYELEIDGERVEVLREERVGGWIFYVFSHETRMEGANHLPYEKKIKSNV